MKEFIYPEMMVHVSLCTSKNPQNVLVVSSDAQRLEDEIKRHSDTEYSIVKSELDALRDNEDKSFDVVISEMSNDAVVIAHINRVLKDDGLVVLKHPSLDNVEDNKALMQILGNYFKIIMPYRLDDSTTILLASKEYHPTADIILQRSDMLDNLNYYNCDVHISSFAMPNYIRKEYLGIIKN